MMNTPKALQNPLQTYWQKDLLPLLADLKLAIVLFLLIALFSISGTVIEQGQSLSFYQENYPESPALFGFLTWKVLLTIGLDHVYRTWWFTSLLILFGSSLTACTFQRQLPSLKAAQNWSFYRQPRQFEKLALSTSIPPLTPEQWQSLPQYLQQRGYRCFQDETQTPETQSPELPQSPISQALYARKGLIGRIGPIVVHISLLILIAGTMVGAATGFFAQEMVPSGETFRVQNIFDAGPWSKSQIPQDWAVRVNRFWIDYTPDGHVDQFYSDLSVVNDRGEELKQKVIHVNEPLRYQGVTFYQADWSIAAVRVSFNNSPVLQLPMAKIDLPEGGRIWGTWIPTAPDLSTGVSVVAKDLQGAVILYNNDGQPIGTLREGMSQQVNGVTLTLHGLVGSTGLQIKADPGIPIVYLGFGLLMISVLMSYVSHSQIWLLQTDDRLYIGGRTNRAQVTFEQELLNLFSDLSTSDTVRAASATSAPYPHVSS
jgi:cytochrome c biogenesis protein